MANDLVLGVNELQDGSAASAAGASASASASAIKDISIEFERLRHTATVLGLPNPNSMNWTRVVSSTSDSAATQKRINRRSAEK